MRKYISIAGNHMNGLTASKNNNLLFLGSLWYCENTEVYSKNNKISWLIFVAIALNCILKV